MIDFSTLLRVELGKATDTRAARWLLGLTGAATVLIMLAPILVPKHIDQNYSEYMGFATAPLAILLPIVAILTLTSEWTQRTVLTTFTQEPRRLRILRAKLGVSVVLALAGALVCGAVTAASLAIAAATGRHVDVDVAGAAVAGLLLFALLSVLNGAAFGAVVQNTAGAIVLSLVASTIVGLIGEAVPVVQHWFDTGTTFQWALDGHFAGHGANIAVSALVWVAVPLAAGMWRTAHREVK